MLEATGMCGPEAQLAPDRTWWPGTLRLGWTPLALGLWDQWLEAWAHRCPVPVCGNLWSSWVGTSEAKAGARRVGEEPGAEG